MAENIIEIKGLSKSFIGHTALTDIDLEIPKNEIFGLLGPNGAGKTTLIRIINRITAADSGTVLFNGNPMRQKDIEQIGYLPEERGLYKKMKVGEQAMYLARLKGMTKDKAAEKLKFWFEKFGIEDWWHKKIEELSKGMAQKIQFIITVMHEPQLLILDEPFSGFDPINTNLIKQEILDLKERGTTVIFSTHNMGSVEEVCDRIALINLSEKILEGEVSQLKQDFKPNIFNITFKGNIVTFTNALWTGFKLLNHRENKGIIEAEIKLLNNNSPNDLLSAVLPYVQVLSLNEQLPSVNDIFIEKVSEIKSQATKEAS